MHFKFTINLLHLIAINASPLLELNTWGGLEPYEDLCVMFGEKGDLYVNRSLFLLCWRLNIVNVLVNKFLNSRSINHHIEPPKIMWNKISQPWPFLLRVKIAVRAGNSDLNFAETVETDCRYFDICDASCRENIFLIKHGSIWCTNSLMYEICEYQPLPYSKSSCSLT